MRGIFHCKHPVATHHDGFTLIELILVMALLVVVLGVAFPSLKGFFRGRNLDSEARRFLSLTRYGQSRAVSEGVPMVLWIDAKQRSYGLQTAAGYTDRDSKAVEFELDKDLQVEVTAPAVNLLSSQWKENTQVAGAGNALRNLGNVPMIRFSPDGFIGESSPASVRFLQGESDVVWILQNTNRLGYEIPTNQVANLRR
ncbi:MAG: GspH/FimT family pseudopilin [Verrucomicrobia bacterium]|nr:GspH/FimT family pseudopilin [Verrucomicrobiota bacterium]